MALKIVRPRDTGMTIKAELKTSRVIQATTKSSTIRNTKLYRLKNVNRQVSMKDEKMRDSNSN